MFMTPKPNFKKAILMAVAFCLLMVPVLAVAQGAADLKTTVTSKVQDISTILEIVGGIVVAIGVSIAGIKMALGHQDAWGFASKVAIGGVLIASSGAILNWLGVKS